MISECKIQNYICQIELEISDGTIYYDNLNIVQFDGMLYGTEIAHGIKNYPIGRDNLEMSDDFKRGLIQGLKNSLFGFGNSSLGVMSICQSDISDACIKKDETT